jgi:small subunit ribosomal protein S27e
MAEEIQTQNVQEKKKSGFIKVRCHSCGHEQTIFGRASTKVDCLGCKEELVIPRGGKAAVKGEILELL